MQFSETRKRLMLTASVTLAVTMSAAAHGDTLFWDTNGSAAGTGTTIPAGTGSGYGTWGTDQFWSANSGGNAIPSVTNTTNIDELTFAAGTNAPAAYSIDVTGSQGAASITFQEGAATLAGTAIDLGATAVILSGAAGTGVINNNLTGAATSLTLNANSATSSITLGGTNSYSGLTIIGNLGTTGTLGSQVVLTGSNTTAGDTRINGNNTLVLASNSNGGLASGFLQLGHGSAATGSAILRSSDATPRTLSNLITFPNQGTSAATFAGVGDITFTNPGPIAINNGVNSAIRTIAVDDASMTVTIVGALQDAGITSNLVKNGNGRLVLAGANTYIGSTNVTAGTLLIDGSTAGFINVTGGTLAGTGTLNGRASVAGTLAVGDGGVGTLTFEFEHPSLRALALTSTATATFEINGFSPGSYDLALGGLDAGAESVGFDGTLSLVFAPGFNTIGSAKFFDFSTYFGSFDTVLATGLAPDYVASFDNASGVVSVLLVPEPGAACLLLLSLGTILVRRGTHQ